MNITVESLKRIIKEEIDKISNPYLEIHDTFSTLLNNIQSYDYNGTYDALKAMYMEAPRLSSPPMEFVAFSEEDWEEAKQIVSNIAGNLFYYQHDVRTGDAERNDKIDTILQYFLAKSPDTMASVVELIDYDPVLMKLKENPKENR